MIRLVSVLGLVTALSSGTFFHPLALTPERIARSIRAGESDVPLKPYHLEQHYGQPPGPTVAIYTPYLKVALAARTARARGSSVTTTELASWITEPSVLAVFRTPCAPARCADTKSQYNDELLKVYTGPHLLADDVSLPRIPATHVTRDLRFLEEIGGAPFDSAVVAAMFALEAIRPQTSIVAAWSTTDEIGPDLTIFYSGGRVTPGDLIQWNTEYR